MPSHSTLTSTTLSLREIQPRSVAQVQLCTSSAVHAVEAATPASRLVVVAVLALETAMDEIYIGRGTLLRLRRRLGFCFGLGIWLTTPVRLRLLIRVAGRLFTKFPN